MVMEADPIAGKHTEDRVHGASLRARAGGDVIAPERSVSSLDLAMQYSAPSNLVLTPAPECRKLSRGISRATDNEGLVWALRSNTEPEPSNLSSDHILLLPDISVYPPDFRTFIEKDLLETATLVTLESAGILNWWRHGRIPGAPRLLPLATSGDGNCLPHAASLAAYGFHDRLLALRTKVQALLSGEGGDVLTNAIKRRWRWSESLSLKSAGLTPSEAEWEREWRDAVSAASAEPRPRASAACAVPPAPHYAGLEQLHVLALAHVMRRPVVVFADVALRDFRGDPIAPIPFGGIYLPLELDPESCSKAPILLAYDAGHFSALVPCEPLPTDGARVPLEDQSGNPLPIRFNVDPGDDFRWEVEPDQKTINNLLPDEYQRSSMLAAYLDLEQVECLVQGQPPEELRRSLDALSTKSSKQMNSVAKQFGSIGRSMSSKLKKNFGSMAKLGGRGSHSNPEEGGARLARARLRVRTRAGRARARAGGDGQELPQRGLAGVHGGEESQGGQSRVVCAAVRHGPLAVLRGGHARRTRRRARHHQHARAQAPAPGPHPLPIQVDVLRRPPSVSEALPRPALHVLRQPRQQRLLLTVCAPAVTAHPSICNWKSEQ